MELLNFNWILKNYFIAGILRRWYVILAIIVGLWSIMEIWSSQTQKIILSTLIAVVAGFILFIFFLIDLHIIATIAKWFKQKSKQAICPECFAGLPIQFSCQCGKKKLDSANDHHAWEPAIRVPYISYMTKGLFINHCWECGGEFFPEYSNESTLCGVCDTCGNMIKEWDLFMLHQGKIVVSIEKSLEDFSSNKFLNDWKTGSHHQKLKGGDHLVKEIDTTVVHWFRWGESMSPDYIPQKLTERIHYIWLDKESGTSGWQRTSTFLNYIRKEFKDIVFGFNGTAEELRSSNLGIVESEIIFSTSLEEFIDKLINIETGMNI